jgi:pSer/pThr/pTyr-binding forkhead associated (FHA) protein
MDVRLVMFKESGERKEFPLGEGMTLVGRQEDCDLRIPLSDISRRHAQVLIHDDAVVIRDLGSANGTFVNNKRVTEQELQPGDHIVFGPVVFTVQIDGEPKDLRAVRTKVAPKPKSIDDELAGAVADASAGTKITDLDEDDLFGSAGPGDSSDPISALEQLAASGEQSAIDEILSDEETGSK